MFLGSGTKEEEGSVGVENRGESEPHFLTPLQDPRGGAVHGVSRPWVSQPRVPAFRAHSLYSQGLCLGCAGGQGLHLFSAQIPPYACMLTTKTSNHQESSCFSLALNTHILGHLTGHLALRNLTYALPK